MKLKLWQVDAFTANALEGNPAAVMPLDAWLDSALMQRIAAENSLPMTAFFVKTNTGHYEMRWFTPEVEVNLCGHATLASAHILFTILDSPLNELFFSTRSGELHVSRGTAGSIVLSLPSNPPDPFDGPGHTAAAIGKALNSPLPAALLKKDAYLMAVWDHAGIIRSLAGPGDIAAVLKPLDAVGLIVTAPGGEGYDFVSRFFAPGLGIPEDPVTGSAHCMLTPFWAKRLGRKVLRARQASPRGGDLTCTDEGDRTILAGNCALYLTGEIEI